MDEKNGHITNWILSYGGHFLRYLTHKIKFIKQGWENQ